LPAAPPDQKPSSQARNRRPTPTQGRQTTSPSSEPIAGPKAGHGGISAHGLRLEGQYGEGLTTWSSQKPPHPPIVRSGPQADSRRTVFPRSRPISKAGPGGFFRS
jgi:hypothetical protein